MRVLVKEVSTQNLESIGVGMPFAEEDVLFSPVGFKGAVSLLEKSSFVPGDCSKSVVPSHPVL